MAEKKTPVLLKYAGWDEAGIRHEAGEIVEISIPLAKAWIAEGKADRADKFPGED